MLVDFLTGITRAIDGALVGHDGKGVASPWHGWLTLVLMRQRSRQAWHRQVVQSLRDVDADADDDEGAVPGMPGWRFAFHGMGCCLAGPDGEVIDVDHHDEAAAIIDPWFFAWRIASIRTRDLPERRLWRWLPGASVLVVALADLRAMGVLEYPQGDHMFRLCDALEGRVAALAAVDFADPAVTERWQRALGDHESPAVIAAQHRWFIDRATNHPRAHAVLGAAAEVLTPDELHGVLAAILDGPIDANAGQAVEVMRTHDHPHGVERVRRLLDRITTTDPPYPAYQALAYLLEHDAGDAHVRARFGELAAVEKATGFQGNPFLGEHAILALRHLPDLAMPLVRRALRSTTPIAVSDLASMLAAVDQPWCHRELSVALAERPGDSYLAEALRRSCSPEARAAATPYTPPNTTRPASASRTRRSSTTASPRCSPTCPRGTGRSPSSFAAASRPTGPADLSDRSTFTPSRKLEHFRPARPGPDALGLERGVGACPGRPIAPVLVRAAVAALVRVGPVRPGSAGMAHDGPFRVALLLECIV